MNRVIFITLSLLLISCNTQNPDLQTLAQTINKETILKDVNILSADEMQGRGTGTVGEKQAQEFIAARYEAIGLTPINGSYFQNVKLIGFKKDQQNSSMQISTSKSNINYISDKTLTYWSSSQKETVDIKKAPLIFVGYGVQAPEHNWDDYKKTDVSGKVLLFLNNDPPVSEKGQALFAGEARTYYGRYTYKFEQAMKLGAVGAIMIHTTPSASYPFGVIGDSGEEEHFALDLANSGYQVDLLSWIDENHSNEIAKNMGTTLQGLFEMAASRDFKPVDTGYKVSAHIKTEIRRIETKNVMGLLEGSDAQLKEEMLVFSAHYDHLGTKGSAAGDTIFNGAWDNALGTSCIINLAEAFSKMQVKPRRSVLFLACAAEEKGILGSGWFVNNPPFALNKVIANINIDMPQIFGITKDIAAVGLNSSSLGKNLEAVASKYAIAVMDDLNPNAGRFYRSDQVHFAKAGIPALYLNPGNQYIKPISVDPVEYRKQHYHKASDEVNAHWDLSGAERDMRIIFETAIEILNTDEAPKWVSGNEFEEEWKLLYGKN